MHSKRLSCSLWFWDGKLPWGWAVTLMYKSGWGGETEKGTKLQECKVLGLKRTQKSS
jgi:hypothetical protein